MGYIPDVVSMHLLSKLKVIFVAGLLVGLIADLTDESGVAYVEINAQASAMALMTVRFFSGDG